MKLKTMPSLLPKVLKILISVTLIWWLVSSGHLDLNLIRKSVSPAFFLFLLLVSGLNLFLANLRWFLLLNNRGLKKSIWETVQLSLIGLFFNYMIPGAVGGDLIKGYYVTKDHPEKKMSAATSVLVDRVIGLYGMICLALLAILFNLNWILGNPRLTSIAATLSMAFVGTTLVFILSLTSLYDKFISFLRKQGFYKKIHWAVKVLEAFHSFTRSPVLLLKCLVLSLFAQSLFVISFYYVAQAIGETAIPLAAFFFVIPIGLIITALPLAPAGVGVGQLAFLYLFKAYTGTTLQVGQTGITLIQVTLFLWGLAGAYFYLGRSKHQKINLKSLDEVTEN